MFIHIQPENIPRELALRDQWVVWRYEEKTKPPYNPISGQKASSTNPATWTSFAHAVAAVNGPNRYDGIGFVTTDRDPYTFIDLDDTSDPILREKQTVIANYFDSYSETSPSGKGLHIVVRGSVPSAIKLPWIEIYSTARYMTMTGRMYKMLPIRTQHAKLNAVWEQLQNQKILNGQIAESEIATESDQVIFELASNARNGQKFLDLWNGRWNIYNYPSPSEGDFALMNMLVFYTDNFEQCKRLFMSSPAGHRDKVWKRMQKSDDYLRKMFVKGCDLKIASVNIDKLKIQMQQVLVENQNTALKNGEIPYNPDYVVPVPLKKVAPISLADSPYLMPTGLTGEIAKFIWQRSYKPIPEIAIVGALGLMAGLCGRSYNTDTLAGLNLYLLFLGDTGIGKEEMRKGIDALTNACRMTAPTIDQFKGPATFASGQALVSYLAEHSNCFLSVLNEFGTLWKRLTNPRASGSDQEFIAMLLQLYSMSGKSDVFAKKAFSDSKKNFPDIRSPSFSFIGQSTSQTFLDYINEETIESGFLPRLLIVNYKGGRPRSNHFAPNHQPPQELIKNLSNLINGVTQMNQRNQVFQVPMSEPVKTRSMEFEIQIDDQINSTRNSILRQLWNRAHLNVIKLATILAVGDNFYRPCVSMANFEYAMNLVNRNIEEIANEFATGIVGSMSAENAQIQQMIRVVSEYAYAMQNTFTKYGITDVMFEKRVIPYRYFAGRLATLRCFKKELRPRDKIKTLLQNLVDNGDLAQVSPAIAQKVFHSTGKIYAIANPEILRKHREIVQV